jgi:FixJ family two-component response regulator
VKNQIHPAKPAPRPSVILVDDEQPILDGMRRALMLDGGEWDITLFDDPHEVLNTPLALSCSVIVTDLRMPGLNGLELLERLRARGVTAEMIILTGTGDLVSAMDAINKIRVFRYYAKPCPPARLIEGITEAIRHREGSAAPADVADLLPFGILGLDSDRRITFMNKEGARMIAAGDVIVADAAGRCRAATPQQTATLYRIVDEVAGGGDAAVCGLDGTADGSKYAVVAERQTSGRPGLAFLFLINLSQHRSPPAAVLKQLFNLSKSEARLAEMLASGLDLKDAAEAIGITVLTARTYLKTIFEKTGANRQADLVRILISAVPPVRTDAH